METRLQFFARHVAKKAIELFDPVRSKWLNASIKGEIRRT
jgi:hypothetical protein